MDSTVWINGLTWLANGILKILPVAGGFFGLWCLARAMKAVIIMGNPERNNEGYSWSTVSTNAVIGAFFMVFGWSGATMVHSLFGSNAADYRNAVAYVPGGATATGVWKQVLVVCALWVHMIGWLGLWRGFNLFRQAGDGASRSNEPGTDLVWRGLVHVIGGLLCINIGGLFG